MVGNVDQQVCFLEVFDRIIRGNTGDQLARCRCHRRLPDDYAFKDGLLVENGDEIAHGLYPDRRFVRKKHKDRVFAGASKRCEKVESTAAVERSG